MISNPASDPKNSPKIRIRDFENPDPEQHCVVFLTRVFPNPKPVCLAIFWYPKPGFFQPPNLRI